MDFVVGLPTAQTRHGDAIADRLSKFASYEPFPRVLPSPYRFVFGAKPTASRRRRGRRRKDGGNPRSFRRKRAFPPTPRGPEVLARKSGSPTGPKMLVQEILAQEMPSATRSEEEQAMIDKDAETNPPSGGSDTERQCEFPAERSKHGVDEIAVASLNAGYAGQLLLSSRYRHVEIGLIPRVQIGVSQEVRCPMPLEILDG